MISPRKMFVTHAVLALMCAALLLASIDTLAQAYPAKPIRLIVPSAAGGSPDISARYFSNDLTKLLGQQVVVDNRPGAANLLGFAAVARATPDGYTIGYGEFSLSTNPSLYLNMVSGTAAALLYVDVSY